MKWSEVKYNAAAFDKYLDDWRGLCGAMIGENYSPSRIEREYLDNKVYEEYDRLFEQEHDNDNTAFADFYGDVYKCREILSDSLKAELGDGYAEYARQKGDSPGPGAGREKDLGPAPSESWRDICDIMKLNAHAPSTIEKRFIGGAVSRYAVGMKSCENDLRDENRVISAIMNERMNSYMENYRKEKDAMPDFGAVRCCDAKAPEDLISGDEALSDAYNRISDSEGTLGSKLDSNYKVLRNISAAKVALVAQVNARMEFIPNDAVRCVYESCDVPKYKRNRLAPACAKTDGAHVPYEFPKQDAEDSFGDMGE